MFKQLKNNENGVVFVTVLMLVIVIMTITVGIIGLNVSQVTYTEQEVQRLQAEILSLGAMAYVFANQTTPSAGLSISFNETLGNLTYTVNATITDDDSGPNASDPLVINIDY